MKADPTASVSLSSSPGEEGSVAPSGAFTTGGATSFGSQPPLIVVHGKLQRAQRDLRQSLTNARRALALWCDVTQDGAPYMKALELTSKLEELIGQAIDDIEDRLR